MFFAILAWLPRMTGVSVCNGFERYLVVFYVHFEIGGSSPLSSGRALMRGMMRLERMLCGVTSSRQVSGGWKGICFVFNAASTAITSNGIKTFLARMLTGS